MTDIITTQVDKFVSLIFAKKKILLSEAASELNLLPSQAEEWALALKEHNIISIDYTLQGMVLIAKALTQEQYTEKLVGFADKERKITNLVDEIERSLLPYGRGEMWARLKEIDKNVDETIRRYRYVYNLFSRRNLPTAAQELERKNYEIAVETDKQIYKLYDDFKKLEKQHNNLRDLIMKVKEELILLEKQSQDVEKLDLKNFMLFLDKVEKQSVIVEKEKIAYISKLEEIRTKLRQMREKIGG